MDMTNLQSRAHVLLDYLVSKGYHKSTVGWAKRCIKLALQLGSNNEIRCYKDIFEAAVKMLHFSPSENRYKALKSTFGMVEDFDINGGYPNSRPKGFNKPQDTVEKLSPGFKAIALQHKEVGLQGENGIKLKRDLFLHRRCQNKSYVVLIQRRIQIADLNLYTLYRVIYEDKFLCLISLGKISSFNPDA